MNQSPETFKELHLWTEPGLQSVSEETMRPYLRWLDKGNRILDIGCGDGRFTRFLSLKGFKVSGVDINPELVSLCKSSGLPVELMDAAEAVTKLGDQYNTFCMLDFVEHVPMETFLFLMGAISKQKGARIWIQTPNLDSIMGFKFWFHMPSHVLPLHPWVLRKLLTRFGFKILDEWTDYGRLPWTGFRRWLTIKFLNAVFGAPQAQMFLGGGNICLVAEAQGESEVLPNLT